MEIFGRRRATPEELAQGEKEMREEQERLKKERMSEFLEQQDAAVARSLVFEERPQATIEDQGEEGSMEKILQEQSALQEQQSRDSWRQQQMKNLLLKDEEKLLLARRVQELEERSVKLQKSCELRQLENETIAKENQRIAKENEDMRRLLRRLVKNEEQAAGEEARGVEEEPRFSTPEEEKKYLRTEETPVRPSSTEAAEAEKLEAKTPMDLMMKMMTTMQKMVEKSEGKKDGEDKDQVETVRSGVIEMPQLPEWSVEHGRLAHAGAADYGRFDEYFPSVVGPDFGRVKEMVRSSSSFGTNGATDPQTFSEH